MKFDGTVHNTYTPGAAIALSVPTSVDLVNIYGVDSSGQVDPTVSIGAVAITSVSTTGSPALDVLIGEGAFPTQPNSTLLFSTDSLSGLTIDSSLYGKCRIAGAIAGNLTGAVDAGSIFRLQVGGNVSANITGRPLDGGTVAIDQLLVGGSIGSGATIEAVTGNIQRVEAGWQNTTGDIGSSVRAPLGKIGTVTTPGNISISDARGVQARDGIDSIAANVSANLDSIGGSGTLTSLRANTGGMTGNLDADYLPENSSSGGLNDTPIVEVNGDFFGNIHVKGDMIGGIRIHGRMASTEQGDPLDGGVTVDGNAFGWVQVDGVLHHFRCAGDVYSLGQPGAVFPTFVRASSIAEILVQGVALWDGYTHGFQVIADTIGSIDVGGGMYSFQRAPLAGSTEPRFVSIASLRSRNSLLGEHFIESAGSIQIDGDFGEPEIGIPDSSMSLHQLAGTLTIGGSQYRSITIGGLWPESEFAEHYFSGQIIVNAKNLGGSWDHVQSRKYGEAVNLYSNGTDGRYVMPIASSAIGGGAVGQVPYRAYDIDCNPPNDLPWANQPGPDPLLNTAFSDGTRSATMRFYGPVRSAAPTTAATDEKPVTFWFWLNRASQWTNLTSVVDIQMAEQGSGSMSREIRVTGTGEPLPPGYYAITVNRVPRDVPSEQFQYHVYCDGTLASVPPAPAANVSGALEYHFRLWPDCDHNGVIDPELTLCPGEPLGSCCADIAGGGITGTNPDNAVDFNDLVVFMIWFEDGLVEVDIDDGTGTCTPDGAVDISDLLAFLAHFEIGC